jgi:exosortase
MATKKPKNLNTIKKIYLAFIAFINIPALLALATTLFYFYTWSERTIVAGAWLFLAMKQWQREKLKELPTFESRYLLGALLCIVAAILTNIEILLWLGAALSLYSYLVYFHGSRQALKFIPLLGMLLLLSRINSPTALELLSLNLRIISTKTATFWLTLIGIPASNISTTCISSPRLICTIDTACNGMNTLYALTILAFFVAYHLRFLLRQTIILVTTGVALALLTNTLRIWTLFVIGYHYGATLIAPDSVLHTGIGVFWFIIALSILVAIARILQKQSDNA